MVVAISNHCHPVMEGEVAANLILSNRDSRSLGSILGQNLDWFSADIGFDGCTSLSDMRGAGMLRFSRHDRRIRDSVSRVPIVQWLPSLS